jgi:Zn-dependent protease
MNSLAVLLFKLFSLAKFSKFFLSIGSIAISVWTYSLLFGWPYAAGFVALIFCHEMGHYIAARQKNLDVGLPTFLPFVGAWIQLKEQPVNAEVEAYVAYAGPLVGTLSAFALYFLGRETDNHLFLALAQAGFLINLFNLIPLHPLDGGRITAIISPRIWFLGVPLLIAMWFYHPNPVLILIAIIALPQLKKAWYFDPASPANKAYYDINSGARFEYTVLYLGLAVILALMIEYK